MPHRDERIPKTVEARAISHDPLIEDDIEQDEPMFEGSEVLAEDKEAHAEEKEHAGLPERGRDTEANAENAKEPDESANVADANVNPQNESGDKVTKAADVTPRRKRASKAKE
jgi:hypothetical protein